MLFNAFLLLNLSQDCFLKKLFKKGNINNSKNYLFNIGIYF